MNEKKTEAATIINDFEANLRAMQKDFIRCYTVWDAYSAIDGGQYTPLQRQTLREEERHPWQFDVLSPKVDTLAGTLIADLPDIDWNAITGENTMVIEALKEQYFIDKELFNWDDMLLYTIRDGCVHSGWIQLAEDKKYSPTGNISLKRCRPGYIVPDCYWKTDDDRDLEVLYKYGYYKPENLKRIFQAKSDDIERAIEKRKLGRSVTDENATSSNDVLQQTYQAQVGDEWRVIEKHYISVISKERLVGAKIDPPTGQMYWIPFPLTDDKQKLQAFAEANGIDMMDVQVTQYDEKVHNVKTVTDLDKSIVLEDGKSRVQVNGLPFYHFTCNRVNGHDRGIAESILDAQRVINEKESMILEYIGKASGGGSVWNEDLFKDEKQKQRFAKKRNQPGHIEFADLDAVRQTHIDVNPANVPSTIFQEISRMYNETIPIVSRVSDAMSAITNPGDSGILTERKYQMNRIGNVMYDKFVKQLLNNIGEGFFYQFQITYDDVQRDIKTRSGSTITINQKQEMGGQRVVINSVSNIPRCKVIVTESTKTPIFQLRKRMEIAEIIKDIPPEDYLRRQQALSIFFENTPMNDEDKAKMDVINELENTKAMMQFTAEMSTLQTTIATNKNQQSQLEMMSQRMNAAKAAPPAQGSISPELQQGAPAPAQAPQQEQQTPAPVGVGNV